VLQSIKVKGDNFEQGQALQLLLWSGYPTTLATAKLPLHGDNTDKK
jgi:hypothetical protein